MPNNALTPEELYPLLEEFFSHVQSGSLGTKKFTQRKIAGFEVGAGFGMGRRARIPWVGFFAKGQTAHRGIYPVCLYYRQHDLLIVTYGVSERNKASIQWGEKVTSKTKIHEELQRRGISAEYKQSLNSTGVMYGDSFIKACFDNASKISGINDVLFNKIYSNLFEVLGDYTETLKNLTIEDDFPKEFVLLPTKDHDALPLDFSKLDAMKNSFLKIFTGFTAFSSCKKYLADERQYKDELKELFDKELLPLLKSPEESSAPLIPIAIDKLLRARLKTTGTNQNIIHWLTWDHLRKLDEESSKAIGTLYRNLLDETVPLQERLDKFEEEYVRVVDKQVPTPKGKRSWPGILRPLTSFILAFAFPGKYIFVRTQVFERASVQLLGTNICADYTAHKSTLGREYIQIMKMSQAVNDALAEWSPRDFIDIQSFFWVGAQKSLQKETVLQQAEYKHSADQNVLETVESIPLVPYEEPDLRDIESFIKNSGMVLHDRTLRRYHLSLKTRKFVILAGVSGTGKTWLAELYAQATNSQYHIAQVAPNWTSNEDLLGYHNPLSNTFCPTGFTTFLQKACNAQEAADEAGVAAQPYHLILDEMNLARVEHYFARFLSAMELGQRGAIPQLELGPETTLFLPQNLRFIGTVNVDETTHSFADKVFDRAQLIELPLESEQLAAYIAEKPFADVLMSIWNAVHHVAPFAYRVLDDFVDYIASAEKIGIPWTKALDEMVVQKVLPRIKGNDSRLDAVFATLEDIARQNELDLVLDKVTYMRTCYHEHGFTSFFQ